MNEIGIDEEAIIQIVDRHMEECWRQKKLERKSELQLPFPAAFPSSRALPGISGRQQEERIY